MRAHLYRMGQRHATYLLDSEPLRLMVWTTAERGWDWRIA